MKLEVECVVCLVFACWLAYRDLSLKSRRHVNSVWKEKMLSSISSFPLLKRNWTSFLSIVLVTASRLKLYWLISTPVAAAENLSSRPMLRSLGALCIVRFCEHFQAGLLLYQWQRCLLCGRVTCQQVAVRLRYTTPFLSLGHFPFGYIKWASLASRILCDHAVFVSIFFFFFFFFLGGGGWNLSKELKKKEP